jgi:hypothetical protein
MSSASSAAAAAAAAAAARARVDSGAAAHLRGLAAANAVGAPPFGEREKPDYTPQWGALIVFCSMCIWVVLLFPLFGAKLLTQETGNPLVDLFRVDSYYPLLLSMTLPVAMVGVYLNWLAMKFYTNTRTGG